MLPRLLACGSLLLWIPVASAGCGSRSSLLAADAGAGGASTSTGGASTTSVPLGQAGSAGSTGSTPACAPGGAPVSLGSHLVSGLSPIAADADFVYFGSENSMGCNQIGRIERIPGAGGDRETLWETGTLVTALAVDDQQVYWTEDPEGSCLPPEDPGQVLHLGPKGGGEPKVSSPTKMLVLSSGMALDATNVYWVAPVVGASLFVAPKDGGATTTFASSSTLPTCVAVDGDKLYFGSPAGLMVTTKGKASPEVLVPALPSEDFTGVAVDADSVYFARWHPCEAQDCTFQMQIGRVPKGQPGAVKTLAFHTDWRSWQLAIDATHVYWTDSDMVGTSGGAVRRVGKDGTGETQLAPAKTPYSLALDGSCVFWADDADGSIWRAPK